MSTHTPVTPTSAEALADILRECSERQQAVVPWGAGTLQHLGGPAQAKALRLFTTGLDQVIDYNPADLTITVGAGTSLATLQEVLHQHNQWLPWDPPTPTSATIGGLLAAGVSGPLRLGYGTPRDWVLGMRVALGDGRLVKSGGKVVKNVAGYEAHKLHIGALGTLGVIVEVTCKVFPLPERIGSLAVTCATREAALALAERLRERPLAPASLAVIDPLGAFSSYTANQEGRQMLALRCAGVASAVERQLRAAERIATRAGAQVIDLSEQEFEVFWQAVAMFPAPRLDAGEQTADQTLLLRAGAAPAQLAALMTALERRAPVDRAQMVGYSGVGLVYARWPLAVQAADDVPQALAALRADASALGGYAVIEDAPANLRQNLDLWGPPPATLPLMRNLKGQFDPNGVLNAGRYVGGL